jgi:branched-subunit amino acid aminotransferase/4-amino-4-deoxychorismate lyase
VLISVNGRLVDRAEALVSAQDRGLMYGDGVYTTLKVRHGTPLFLDLHLDRLAQHMARLHFGERPHPTEMRATMIKLASLISGSEGYLRVTVTRGMEASPPAFACKQPTVIVMAGTRPAEGRPDYVDVITLPDQRDALRDIKSVNRMVPLLAMRQALLAGAQEAVLTDGGELVEATCHNLFALQPDGELLTPPLEGRGLKGIARHVLCAKLAVREAVVPVSHPGPLFLTNSLVGVVGIRRLDGRELLADPEALHRLQGALLEVEAAFIRDHGPPTVAQGG